LVRAKSRHGSATGHPSQSRWAFASRRARAWGRSAFGGKNKRVWVLHAAWSRQSASVSPASEIAGSEIAGLDAADVEAGDSEILRPAVRDVATRAAPPAVCQVAGRSGVVSTVDAITAPYPEYGPGELHLTLKDSGVGCNRVMKQSSQAVVHALEPRVRRHRSRRVRLRSSERCATRTMTWGGAVVGRPRVWGGAGVGSDSGSRRVVLR
jgi:hypothetical protein